MEEKAELGMKCLKMINDHGWTTQTLRKQEQKIKNTDLRQRVIAVRLVMERLGGQRNGYYDQCAPPTLFPLCVTF
ncbi:hypothetical protein GTHT12_01592 [Geobacillus thermodenitrificans]|jgi:hypothetical protein|nr:hypothetical protein GTHT12_01592 [Geobacillus thermodenitrificans]MEC5189328.1 hypothetical protein [Geobacillus thermodenitrificans]